MSTGVDVHAGRMCRSPMSKQKSQREDVTRDVNDVMHPEAYAEDLGRFEKVSS